MTPDAMPDIAPPEAQQQHHAEPVHPGQPHWFNRLSSLLFIVFCFELGMFLLVYPWTDGWEANYFAALLPDRMLPVWHAFWINPYFRGVVSGLGVVNLWVAMAELFQMFAGKREAR